MFSCVAFGFENRFDFLTAILRVHLVQNVLERGNIVVGIFLAVHLIVNGYKSYVGFGKIIFRVISHKNMISSETGHIFYDYSRNFTVFNVGHHPFEIRSFKVASRKAVVNVKSYVPQMIFVRILLQ